MEEAAVAARLGDCNDEGAPQHADFPQPPTFRASCKSSRTLVFGDSNAEIAEQLFVSHKTIKNHLGTIYERMGVRNRVEAATVTLLYERRDSSVAAA